MIKFLNFLNTNDSFSLIFGISLKILISIGISFLILRSQMSPHVMYSSAMCKWIFSLGVSQNKEGYNATVFNRYNSLLQLYIAIITIP